VTGQPEDFRSFSMVGVTFSANTAAGRTATTPVAIIDDTSFEPTEYFTVSIIPDPVERIGTIEGQGTATAFILDDDSEFPMRIIKSVQNQINHEVVF
jgi:hypothetical protein